jgi:myo-inositol-1-phosphate synthase
VSNEQRRVGVAVVGLGGAVATTAVAGVELMKLDMCGVDGLPLAGVDSLIPYTSLVFGGWDLNGDDLAKAAHGHRVLDDRQVEAAGAALAAITPWPAAADPDYCRNAVGSNVVSVSSAAGSTASARTSSSSATGRASTASSWSTSPPPSAGPT